MIQWLTETDALPLIFAFVMGLSMLIYAVLDGYDLGVGMMTLRATRAEQETMISSIGPFWDANETWLVLGVGILLVAFPTAHGIVLTELYLPVLVMLIGLILRGVAYEFRHKVAHHKEPRWTRTFMVGSLMTALSQGYMVGAYILGFQSGTGAIIFSMIVAVSVAAGYCLVGSTWLILKTRGELQQKAIRWAKESMIGCASAIALISVATPLVSSRIFDKWFTMPELLYKLPIPVLTLVLFLMLYRLINTLPRQDGKKEAFPFLMAIGIFILCFLGLAYSFYPYIVPEQLKIVDAAAAPGSLLIILAGTVVVLPILFAYTFVAYYVFRGKAVDLTYD